MDQTSSILHHLFLFINILQSQTPDPPCQYGDVVISSTYALCFRTTCPQYGGTGCSTGGSDCCSNWIIDNAPWCDINGPPDTSCKIRSTSDPQCNSGTLMYDTYCFRSDCAQFGGNGCSPSDCCMGHIDTNAIYCEKIGPPTISCKYTTNSPTKSPTPALTLNPTPAPSDNPTPAPTINPTPAPTSNPTTPPTNSPSISPSSSPSMFPTLPPSNNPSVSPSKIPSNYPTFPPTIAPSMSPSNAPTFAYAAVKEMSTTEILIQTQFEGKYNDDGFFNLKNSNAMIIMISIVILILFVVIILLIVFVCRVKKRKQMETFNFGIEKVTSQSSIEMGTKGTVTKGYKENNDVNNIINVNGEESKASDSSSNSIFENNNNIQTPNGTDNGISENKNETESDGEEDMYYNGSHGTTIKQI